MYLPKIELTNYKIYKGSTKFDFAPLTLFTGPNNSGKSSVLQAIMSILSSQKNGYRFFNKLLLNNEFIKLGNFERVISGGSKNEILSFTIPINIRSQSKYILSNFSIQYNFKNKNNEAETDSILIFSNNKSKPLKLFSFKRISKINADFPDDEIWEVYINLEGLVKYFLSNNLIKQNFLFFTYKGNFQNLQEKEITQIRSKEIEFIKWYINDEIFAANLRDFLAYFTQWSYFEDIFTINSSDPERVGNYLNELQSLGFEFDEMDISNEGLDFFYNHLKALIDEIFSHSIENTFYFSSNRTITYIQERVINLSSITSPLIRSTFATLSNIYTSHDKEGTTNEVKLFLKKWFLEFEVGDDIAITHVDQSNIIIDVIKDGKIIPIIDMGLGYRNIAMILFTIASNYYDNNNNTMYYTYMEKPLIIFEEPETNLHPKLQSKLAELFIEAIIKFKTQIIIETHSEYLIRKLQYLVATNIIKSEKIVLYYFNKNDNNAFKKINIDDSGSLNKSFGEGFFDEAANLQFELYKVQSQQNN